MSTATLARPVAVAELQRAHRALLTGQFRRGGPSSVAPDPAWDPSGPVLPVAGAAGGVGASTMALALATAAGYGRVIECASVTASGLAAAPTTELGTDMAGWVAGTRGPVRIERTSRCVTSPHELPVPPQGEGPGLVVLDVAWDPGVILAGQGWLTDVLTRHGPVVVVAVATLPGLGRLDATLTSLAYARPLVALVGSRSRSVRTVLTEVCRRHQLSGTAVVAVPTDARLRARGLGPAPLPAGVLRAATSLLEVAALGGAS